MTLHTHKTSQYTLKLFTNILLTMENNILKVTVVDITSWWPWESMLSVKDRFFEHPWVIGTAFPPIMDINELHVHVTHTQHISCYSTPMCLSRICRRLDTHMCTINYSYTFLHKEVFINLNNHISNSMVYYCVPSIAPTHFYTRKILLILATTYQIAWYINVMRS